MTKKSLARAVTPEAEVGHAVGNHSWGFRTGG